MINIDKISRCRLVNGDSLRRGSVLMEFIIVAPLYFILLGGLFIVGDLAMNKIRFHIGEHFVTWVGASRYCPVVANGGARDPDQIKAWVKPMYDLSIGGAIDNAGFRVDTPKEDVSQYFHNHFMQFYMGRIKKLPVKMPDWARGMLSMGDVMQGNAINDEYATISFERGESFHSYSFHRLPLAGIDTKAYDSYSRSKDIPASQVVGDEILSHVVGADAWINNLDDDKGGAPNPTVKIAVKNEEDVLRFLGAFAE